jgi:hypothetical protein
MNLRNILKIIGTVAVLVVMVLVAIPAADAQQYGTTTHTLTNTIAATTTSTVSTAAYTITKNGEVAVSVSCKLTAAGTDNSQWVFETGVDGSTYDGPTHTITLANAGTTTVNVTSNVTVGALGYIRLRSIGNPDNDGVLTNAVVKYTVKPNRQDGK